IVRMLWTRLGHETFVGGVGRYLQSHDGGAATIEDFIAALEQQSGQSLSGFRDWYSQSGTPHIKARSHYDPESQSFWLSLEQSHPPTADQNEKRCLPIPVGLALWNRQGEKLTLAAQPNWMPEQEILLLDGARHQWRWEGIDQPPVPSLLRGFSAPVELDFDQGADAQAFLLIHESDGFARWNAVQQLIRSALAALMQADQGEPAQILLDALQQLVAHQRQDDALLAELLRLPTNHALSSMFASLDPLKLDQARTRLRQLIAQALTGPLSVWCNWSPGENTANDRGRRALSAVALWYLCALESGPVTKLALTRSRSPNMAVAGAALNALNDVPGEVRTQALTEFKQRFQNDPLVLDKWFALQAGSASGDGLQRIGELIRHPDYSDNPNRCRAVFGTLMRENAVVFHRQDGAGYRLLAEKVAQLDSSNPQLAARLVEGLLNWRKFAPAYAGRMRQTVVALADQIRTVDVREKIEKALAAG
ncbi:MAG: DUF3458 domain-containing protein, partial [Panacagrimonas sp.]